MINDRSELHASTGDPELDSIRLLILRQFGPCYTVQGAAALPKRRWVHRQQRSRAASGDGAADLVKTSLTSSQQR
ncbi:hypothetical protein E6W39_11270 [Kitasatospora acidiphila]|uniref:Uncharacterized protein n=1 Tax=Kitasatospora acidiphila TaxID=2567942 RepID=A0A540W152_9ACTN|nr:hypothetical protein [Kitasatospora acidiphila]TQF02731.1 hypothetical protein E6W39_11270 [Kitasatospora acidiphila]